MAVELETKIPEEPAAAASGINHCGNEAADDTKRSEIRGEPDQRIEMIPLSQLKPHPRNARTHSRKQIRQLAESIKRYGFNNPILVDDRNRIIAGHGRVEAARLLGLAEVPTLRLAHMSEAEVRAYMIADNRLAEKAGWDREVLTAELECLIDLDFNIEVIGFDPGEVEIMLDDADETKREDAGPEDYVPPLTPSKPVSRAGDLWLLGKHRVVCGDARDPAAYELLLDGEKAQLVCTDPSFNVAIDGNVCGKGSIHHREFAMASGEMSPEAFTSFLKSVFVLLASHSQDGSIHQIFMDWRHMGEMLAAGNEVYSELKNVCVWVKKNAGMGSFYRSRHELVFVWKSGTAPHINTFELGQYGRNRTNVWEYAGIGSMGAHGIEQLRMHPTVKPVALVADALRDCSRRNGLVLDPFVGSGTTLIAAERTGRSARGIEIDPLYVDTAVRRWQTYTGKVAVLAATGQSFEEIEEQRTAAATSATNDFGSASGGGVMAAIDRQEGPDYDVGYKRPPKATQFKRGQRANPNGRPRGSKNVKTVVARVLNSKILVRRGNKTSKVPIMEAMTETFALKAAQGDRHAAGVVLNLAAKTGILSPRDDDAPPAADTETAVVAASGRPSDALVESVDPNLLSQEERIELSKFAELVDLGGDAMALGEKDLLRFRQLVNKGRGNQIVPKADNALGEAA